VASGPGDLILEPNENVLLATRPLFLWEPLVLLDIVLIIGSLYFAAPQTGGGTTNTALSGGLLIAAILLMLWLLFKWIPWSRRWFVLTDRRVISKWGVFNRHQAALLLDRIQDASLARPFPLSLIRDYGVIHLETAGEQSQERISGGLQNLSMTQCTSFYRTLTDVQTREHEYLSRDPDATIRQR
jgi:uncharacterized membrane protein YdbT with pleckstrin-like domain